METITLNEAIDLTPGLQCCLRCGRTLTNRAVHDLTEEPLLNQILAEHPEWAAGGDATCQSCVGELRRILNKRQTRAEQQRGAREEAAKQRRGWAEFVSRLTGG